MFFFSILASFPSILQYAFKKTKTSGKSKPAKTSQPAPPAVDTYAELLVTAIINSNNDLLQTLIESHLARDTQSVFFNQLQDHPLVLAHRLTALLSGTKGKV